MMMMMKTETGETAGSMFLQGIILWLERRLIYAVLEVITSTY
jgi:hypothetical protein